MTNPTYSSWRAMIGRCTNPLFANYHKYGAKGITFQENWSSFKQFKEDMGERPTGHTLDRIDSTKGYTKENCRWSTVSYQNRNRKTTGETHLRGVVYIAYRNKYRASLYLGRGLNLFLGYHDTAEYAAKVFDMIYYEWYGDIVGVNFPEELEYEQ